MHLGQNYSCRWAENNFVAWFKSNFSWEPKSLIRWARIFFVDAFRGIRILKFITSHLHSDEREDLLCNYSSLISVENNDVEMFHVCHHILRSLRM